MSLYCLARVLLVISMCKFCRGCIMWEEAWQMAGIVVSASQYRTETHIACSAIPRWEKHSCHHSAVILSRSRSEWLLAVLNPENGPQGDSFHNHGRHQIKCDGQTLEDSKRSLPPVLPTMAGSMEKVYVCPRVLLWRWFGKRCRMSYHYSAIPPFWELFDWPS
jgi:hypothetical protein